MKMVYFSEIEQAQLFLQDYMDEYLVDLINDDGGIKSEDIDGNDIYLGAKEGDFFVGCVRFSKRTNFIAQIHLLIKKEHKSFAKDIVAHSIEWLKENTQAHGIFAEFPDGKMGMQKLADSFGFRRVGFLPGGWVKNGRETDMINYHRRL